MIWHPAGGRMHLRPALRKLAGAMRPFMALSSRRIVLDPFLTEGEPVRGSFWKCTPRGHPDGEAEEPIAGIYIRNG